MTFSTVLFSASLGMPERGRAAVRRMHTISHNLLLNVFLRHFLQERREEVMTWKVPQKGAGAHRCASTCDGTGGNRFAALLCHSTITEHLWRFDME